MTTRKVFSTRLNQILIKQMKYLSIDLDKSVEELTREAFEDLLRKYGKKVRKRIPYSRIKKEEKGPGERS